MMSVIPLLTLLVVLLLSHHHAWAMTDKATGISFAPKSNHGLDIFGVGVRKKGPIKVYSVAMYCSHVLKEQLASFSRTAEKGKKALECLQVGAHEHPTTFLLHMSFKVGAEKMASAIAESVAPRHKKPDEVEELKALILKGVSAKGAAVKGTTLQFDCTQMGVDVSIDAKSQGSVPSAGLAKAFCDVYLDGKCVSPALRDSILENCCAP